MDETVRYYMELESFANDFFNKFTQSVEKNYGSKCFWRVVWYLVRLWYHYCSWNLEVRRPETKIKIWTCNFDYITQIYLIFEDIFEITSRKFIRSKSKRVITLSNSNNEFLLRKTILLRYRKRWYFIEDPFVDGIMLSYIKQIMQRIP